VVVGDLIGSGEAQERGIVGETPNLAARLQGIAGQTWWSSPKDFAEDRRLRKGRRDCPIRSQPF
jgi:hypothetical protein